LISQAEEIVEEVFQVWREEGSGDWGGRESGRNGRKVTGKRKRSTVDSWKLKGKQKPEGRGQRWQCGSE